MHKKRVVITGLGTVNALGNNVHDSWKKAVQGKSGIESIHVEHGKNCPSKVAGTIKDFSLEGLVRKELFNKFRQLGKFSHYAIAAAKEAIKWAKLDTTKSPERIGTVIGSGIGGSEIDVKNILNFNERGLHGISPYHVVGLIGNVASGFASIEHQLYGPSMSVQTACASANYSIAMGMMMIQMGMIDVAICGGTEETINEFSIGSFCRMRALSTKYNHAPEKSSRPFDRDRDGFVMGAGAGILILEAIEHAEKRGATPLCEVGAVAMNTDAHELVSPEPTGERIHQCMQQALNMADIPVEKVDYINTHGTSTPIGDVIEAKAIYKLCGETHHPPYLHIGSTKSMTGHALGAAAGIEGVFSVMSLLENQVPPSINIDHLDDNIQLHPDVFNAKAVQKNVNVVLSNAFGFGGHNSALLLKKI